MVIIFEIKAAQRGAFVSIRIICLFLLSKMKVNPAYIVQKNYQQTDFGNFGRWQIGQDAPFNPESINLNIHILDPMANAPCKHLCNHFVRVILKELIPVNRIWKSL